MNTLHIIERACFVAAVIAWAVAAVIACCCWRR